MNKYIKLLNEIKDDKIPELSGEAFFTLVYEMLKKRIYRHNNLLRYR